MPLDIIDRDQAIMQLPLQIKGGLKVIYFILITLLLFWIYMGCRIGVWLPSGYAHYELCVVGTRPIGHELWQGQIKSGDSLSHLLSRINASRIVRYGDWTEVYIVPGCSKVPEKGLLMGVWTFILAKNDSIVRAEFGSCTFQRVFFDTLTPDESVMRSKDYDDYRQNRYSQNNEHKNEWAGPKNHNKSHKRIQCKKQPFVGRIGLFIAQLTQ